MGAHTGCVQAMLEGYERQRHDIQSSFEGARDDMAAVRLLPDRLCARCSRLTQTTRTISSPEALPLKHTCDMQVHQMSWIA